MISLLSTVIRRILAGVVLLLLLVAFSTSARAEHVHVVAPGHTLGKIAKRYHVSIEKLCAANHISRRKRLKVGQRLVIPSPESGSKNTAPSNPSARANKKESRPSQADQPMTAHLVARGHSLSKIARRYRTSITTLRRANNLGPTAHLRPGQCLLVPLTKRSPRRLLKRPWPCKPAGVVEKKGANNDVKRSIDPYARRPRRPGVVTLVRGNTSWTGRLVTRRKKIPRARALKTLRRLMFDRRTNETHAIAPRLAQVLTRISDHFGARPIHIISGYRGPTSNPYTPHSNHLKGRAVDFTIPGVPKDAVRDFCHTLQHVGVGYYPNSSFIHVDVRKVTTHWTDVSRPGQRPVYVSINGKSPKRTSPHPHPAASRPATDHHPHSPPPNSSEPQASPAPAASGKPPSASKPAPMRHPRP